LSGEDREAKLAEMQAASQALTDMRRDRSGYNKAIKDDEEKDVKNGAKFLSQIR